MLRKCRETSKTVRVCRSEMHEVAEERGQGRSGAHGSDVEVSVPTTAAFQARFERWGYALSDFPQNDVNHFFS